MIGMALMVGALVLAVVDPYPIEFMRLKVFDYYQDTKPREIPPPEQKPVTIIDIDEASLAAIGQWPWDRKTLGDLVRNLMAMQAVLIAFDVVFAEPDRMNPTSIAKSVVGLDNETKEKLLKLKGNDQYFADIIKKSRVVLGQAGRWSEDEGTKAPPVKKSVAIRKKAKNVPEPQTFLPTFPALVRNVKVLEDAAKGPSGGHGIFSIIPEKDGIIRRVPLLFVHEKAMFPALSVEMLRVATGRPTILAEVNVAGMDRVSIAKGVRIPTDRNGRVYPYFSRSDKAKYVSAKDILDGTADPKMIKGKLTILGTSAVGLLDIRAIPTEAVIPGVEVHAQIVESALHKAYLTRPNYADAVELSFIFVSGLLLIILVPWIGAKWTFLLFAATAVGAGGFSWYLFSEQQLLLDASFAIISVAIIYTTMTYTGYAREEAERRQTRDAFSKYLSPDMVSRVAENPGELKLGGEQRELTLLFCDVRGFTTISEQFDAVGLTKLINKLLTPLTNVILSHQGTVDKYMGDCIMAFWNAPLDDDRHAYNGCISALLMLAEINPLNDRLEIEAGEEGRLHIPLRVGLGLNSGDAVVGNMGSDQRFDYSVLGDTVNLAARLEGQSKGYGVDIVIGPTTHDQVPELATLELDSIKVKGKTEAVTIYCLLGDETVEQDQDFRQLKRIHNQMLTAYRAQDWDRAMKYLKECRILCGSHNIDGLYDLYETRLLEFKENPPGEDWDGVFVATTK